MVCPLHKRALIAFLASLLVCSSTGIQTISWAKAPTATINQQNQLGITGVHLSPDGSTLLLDATQGFNNNEPRHLSMMKFPAPYRVLVDIPNAHLVGTKTLFPVHRSGIDRVELSDNQSAYYNSVRAIIYVEGAPVLSNLSAAFEGKTIQVAGFPKSDQDEAAMRLNTDKVPVPVGKAQPLPPVLKPAPAMMALRNQGVAVPLPPPNETVQPVVNQTVLPGPVPAGTNIIEAVSFRNNQLNIQGNTGSDLRIKNRFLLTEPNRLVLDVENAVLRNKTLSMPMLVSSNDIRQIRLGQFDEKTVRIVIEGVSPDQYEAIYNGSDHSQLSISPYASTSVTKLSANTRIGQIESIDLKRENGSTILRLEASTPIVHRFIKRDDRVVLDLLNQSANPTAISVDSAKYPEVARMRLEPLTEGQPNSKLAITLASANVQVNPAVSPDGKVLEITMTPTQGDIGNIPLITNASLGAAGNAPFAARIVLDAGHGGKDLGANRSGVNEKDLNLTLALMVRDALEAKGFKVQLTRNTDVFLPLPQITAITNEARPDLFISIHHNASVNTALNGIETYYYTPQSLALARRVHSREINSVPVRDGGVKRAMFYVIHHTTVPAILCEVGYVSNPNELSDLQTYERKLKTARAIADGVVDYLKASVSARAKPSAKAKLR